MRHRPGEHLSAPNVAWPRRGRVLPASRGLDDYAYHASKALRLAVRISQLAEAKSNLAAALESRTTIDLATGAIMAQNRCSQETAVRILKIASSTRNAKLRDVAASVIASVADDPQVRTHFEP